MVGRMNSTKSRVFQALKTSGHAAPIRRPKETIDHLNIVPCHHFKVNDLKMFINLIFAADSFKWIGEQTSNAHGHGK